MAKINNSDLIKEVIDVARLHPSTDRIPNELAEKIVPVIDINQKHVRICDVVRHVSSTTSGSTNIYTTPSNKDFYLVGASLSISKNATCDDESGEVDYNIIIDGGSRSFIILAKLTLTALNSSITLSLNNPIKIDRGSVISIAGNVTFTVGAMVKAATLIGYTVETE